MSEDRYQTEPFRSFSEGKRLVVHYRALATKQAMRINELESALAGLFVDFDRTCDTGINWENCDVSLIVSGAALWKAAQALGEKKP